MIEECEDLCDFYTDLVEKVGEFSFRLMPDGTTVPNSIDCNPLETPTKDFTASASGRIRTLFQKEIEKRSEANTVGKEIFSIF